MNKDTVKFSLRINTDTYKKVQKIADKNSRSINGQLDFIIRSFIEKYEDVSGKINIDD
jgi:hypothetical protein